MDRIKVPSGSIQKLETVFDDLQTLVDGNLSKKIDAITGGYGVLNALRSGEQDLLSTGLRLRSTSQGLGLFIEPGVALLNNGKILLIENSYNFLLNNVYSGTITGSSFYQINLKWKEVGTDPITAMNAFMFDKAGLTPYAERFTRWSDSYVAVAYLRTEGVAISTPEDEIPLGIIQTLTSTQIDDVTFTFQDPTGTYTAIDEVVDLRKNNTYRLNTDVLDDQLLLFKDRSSIGANKINGSVEATGFLSNTITVSGISTLSTTNINNVLSVTSPNSVSSYININSGALSSGVIIFKDNLYTAGRYRGYIGFDTNLRYVVGFENPIYSPDEPDYVPGSQRLVVTSAGYIGNYNFPTTDLDIKNTSTSSSSTVFKLSHVPATASNSTIFKLGVEYTGGSTYGRGLIQPVTYNRPFEFLNLAGEYVFKLDNTNRKVYAYALEVDTTTTLATTAASTIQSGSLSVSGNTVLKTVTAEYLTVSGLYVSSSNASNTFLTGTSSTEFRVGVGSQEYPSGRLVKLEDPDVETPANFRIYDVSPYPDERTSSSNITFKWNWDGLDGIKQNTYEVVLNSVTVTGEVLNLTRGQAIIRYFYFTSSGNKYEITDYDPSTRTVTLAIPYSVTNDTISDTYPAKIIDKHATSYVLRAVNTRYVTGGGPTYSLDNIDLINNPAYMLSLPLGFNYSFALKSKNASYSSPFVTMQAGSYNPDHVSGGQGNVGYSAPFNNTLPYIDGACSPGSLTLTPTSYGFRLDIEGWESENTETSPHEFEVGYTTLSGITWENSSFSTTRKSGATFLRTTNRTLQITTTESTEWTVGARPIQNNQPVGVPISSSVVTGGGGELPPDTIVFSVGISNPVISGVVAYDVLNTFTPPSTSNFAVVPSNGYIYGNGTLTGNIVTINSQNPRIIENKLIYSGGLDQFFNVYGIDGLPAQGTPWSIGLTKESRFINSWNLPADFTLTSIQVNCTSIENASGSNPLIIRVYQYGKEPSAATIEISGTGTFIQPINLTILNKYGSDRKVMIDAWDPDPTSPNNICSIKGHISVSGRPYGELNSTR